MNLEVFYKNIKKILKHVAKKELVVYTLKEIFNESLTRCG